MTSSVTTRTFSPILGVGFDIRIVSIAGEPWFVAADVCDALGLQKNAQNGSYQTHYRDWLAANEIGKSPILLGSRVMTVVSESGLYKLVLRSDKPQAKPFQDWVTRDVLPTIRETGSYVMGEEKLNDPNLTLSEFEQVQEQINMLQARKVAMMETRLAQLQAANDAMAPKAALVDAHHAPGSRRSL